MSDTASSPHVVFDVCSDSNVAGRLDTAHSIWKKYRSTLGLFPRGAFEDHAAKGWILYLLTGGEVVGYLLYRKAKNRVVIAHLCVDETYRGMGGAKALFMELRNRIEDGVCRGMEVKCRTDYDISPLWNKLGFECVKTLPGRGKQPTELALWFFHLDTNDFFYDMIPRPEEDDLVWAVLDANIVFKLSKPDLPENQEANALLSDTIAAYANYQVTPEIFAEIQRQSEEDQRQVSRSCAGQFGRIDVKRSELEHFIDSLNPLWGSIDKARDRSDLRHIAYTAAAGIGVFITQDGGLLDKSDAILDRCGVRVLRPVEFISELDALENETKYCPIAIARSEYAVKCPGGDEVTEIAKAFTNVCKGEKQKQFEAKLRSALAATQTSKVVVVTNHDNDYLLIYAKQVMDNRVQVNLLRHDGSNMAKAIIQNLIWKELSETPQGDIRCLEIADSMASEETLGLFSQRGFIRSDSGLRRYSIKRLIPHHRVLDAVNKVDCDDQGSCAPLDRFLKLPREEQHSIEEAFWPLKVTDLNIQACLIPIKPTWAMHLFDEQLAMNELLGADPSRFFNWENVYYRSSKPLLKLRPGIRILWYVSAEKKGQKLSAIRACSRLIDMEVDTAKSLYQKYKRLGIYQWRDLMQTTQDNPDGKLMAIRFYQTECFSKPVPLGRFSEFDIKGAPQSPRLLSAEQFNAVYREGMDLNV